MNLYLGGIMKKKNKFQANQTYFTISMYAIGVIIISAIIFRIFIHWETTAKAISHFLSVIFPYFFGFLIAYIVNPLVNFFYGRIFTKYIHIKKKKLKTFLSISLSYILVLGLIITCISYIIPQMITSINDLIDKLPYIFDKVNHEVNKLIKLYPALNSDAVQDFITDSLPNLSKKVQDSLTDSIPVLYNLSIAVIKWLANFLIAIVISVYITLDKKQFRAYLKKIIFAFLPDHTAHSFVHTLNDCHQICKSFFIGKTIDSLIIGVLCFIAMSIFQLPYALLVSTIVCITNMIPYFGPYIGAVPGLLLLLIDSPFNSFIFLIIIIILQMFDGIFLGPKILGSSTGIRPLAILFAISIGGAYAGVLGMLLGVPVFAILIYLFNNFIDNKIKKKQESTKYEENEDIPTAHIEPSQSIKNNH